MSFDGPMTAVAREFSAPAPYRAVWNGKPTRDEIAFVEASHLESEIR